MHSVLDEIAKLTEKYITAEPIYLSEFFKPDGAKKLYDSLQALHQDQYNDNYRIVIVQDCSDVYDYHDLPGLAITTLQKYASQIDISNFFIVLLTSNSNIASELEQARALYSSDDCAIDYRIVSGFPTAQKSLAVRDTFCILPWIHLYVGPDGNVLPCCIADYTHPVGNVEEQSVESILTSDSFNQIRKNMLSGCKSKECSRCYNLEDSGLHSPRTGHNAQWADQYSHAFNQDGTIDIVDPVYLDIRLNNICNLKCRMCSSYFSSAVAQEEVEMFGKIIPILRKTQRQPVLEDLLKYIPSAEKLYFAGGEPLIMSEHYEILNALIKCNNTDLEILYNTNFTRLQYRDQNVLDLWKQFSNVTIGASIDAEGSVAEYVRHGTDWAAVENNLTRLKSECPHVNFTITSTVGFLNVASLIRLQKRWHNTGVLDINQFSLKALIAPERMSLCVLPMHHKQNLEQLLNEHIRWCNIHFANALADQWSKVLNYMWTEDSSHYLSEFKKVTEAFDHHRKESFKEIFPEFQDLL